MSTLRRFALTTAVAIGCFCQIALSQVRPAPNYEVVNLTLGGSNCAVRAIDGGMAVGRADTPGDTAIHAFAWTAQTGTVDIGTLGGSLAEAVATDGTQVVGSSLIAGDGEFHAFRWTDAGGMQDLGTLGGTFSGASSVSGNTIVGTSAIASGELHAFAWTPTTGMVDLGTLGGSESFAVQVHQGLAAGASTTPVGAMRRAVAWLPDRQIVDIAGEPFELDSNGFLLATGEATGVRNGRVVGFRLINAELITDTFTHAFTWTASQGEVDLGVLPGYNQSFAFATDGQLVVGTQQGNDSNLGFVESTFVWTASTGMIDIGPRIQGLSRATHVTAGQVVGVFGPPRRGQGARTFLWTAARGMVDVTPRSYTNGARPAGIDAQGRIAIIDDQGDINFFRSAVLIPRRP